MPITYLNVRMKQRIGLASEWKADNPLLLKGELGIESDTGYVKSGDGSTRYNDLPYLTSPQAETGGKVVASIYQPEVKCGLMSIWKILLSVQKAMPL